MEFHAWISNRGVLCMDLYTWSSINRVLCMEFYTWSSMYGVICMEFYAWSSMHEVLCMKFYAWSSMHGVLSVCSRNYRSSRRHVFFRIGRTETVCTLSQQLPISKGLTCLLRALDLISWLDHVIVVKVMWEFGEVRVFELLQITLTQSWIIGAGIRFPICSWVCSVRW